MSLETSKDKRLLDRVGFGNSTMLPHVVTLLGALLMLECLLFVGVPAVESYETSLIGAFPLVFWLLFYTVLVGGIGILLASAVTGRTYWPHGLALVLANYALFFFLPAARGYRLYGRGTTDILRHYGDVQGIMGTGSLPGIWYPGTHVLMAELTMFGVPLESTQYIIAFLFTVLHIVGIGVLVRAITGRPEGLSIGLAAAVPLVYTGMHISAQPAAISFMLLPLIGFVVERYRQRREFGDLAFIMLLGVCIIYMHPMTSILLSLLIGITAVYSTFHSRFIDDDVAPLSPRLAFVFPILLFAWLINFRQFKMAVGRLVTPNSGLSPGAAEAQEASQISFSFIELVSKFLQLYGTVAIYGLAAGIVVLVFTKKFYEGTATYETGSYPVQFGIGVGIAGVFVLNKLIIGDIIRSSRYAILFAVVLVALGLLHRMRAGDRLMTGMFVIAIIGTAIVGVNATYVPNAHMTNSEYDGTEYLLTNSPETDIYSMDTDHRLEEYILGTNDPSLYPSQMARENRMPERLGYLSSETTAGETFGDSIVVTKSHDMRQHTAAYYTAEQQELLFRYDESSVERLSEDSTANKIYSNGGFEGWEIQGS